MREPIDAKPLANKDFSAVKVRVDADEDYTAQIEIPIKPQIVMNQNQ